MGGADSSTPKQLDEQIVSGTRTCQFQLLARLLQAGPATFMTPCRAHVCSTYSHTFPYPNPPLLARSLLPVHSEQPGLQVHQPAENNVPRMQSPSRRGRHQARHRLAGGVHRLHPLQRAFAGGLGSQGAAASTGTSATKAAATATAEAEGAAGGCGKARQRLRERREAQAAERRWSSSCARPWRGRSSSSTPPTAAAARRPAQQQ